MLNLKILPLYFGQDSFVWSQFYSSIFKMDDYFFGNFGIIDEQSNTATLHD